jgi:hypothetical protein
MNISRKVVAQYVTTILTAVLSWVISRYNVHLDPAMSAAVTAIIAPLSGAVAAWFIKEAAVIQKDLGPAPAPATPSGSVQASAERIVAEWATIERVADAVEAAERAVAGLRGVPTPAPAPAPVRPAPVEPAAPPAAPVPAPVADTAHHDGGPSDPLHNPFQS